MRGVRAAMLLALIVSLACTAGGRDRLANFLFEVPDPGATARAAPDSGLPSPDDKPVMAAASEAGPASHASKFRSIHAPFRDQRCAACHDGGDHMHVREDVKDACTSCHATYFAADITHPPVKKARCQECHVPHRSEQPALLAEPLFATCMECHDEPAKLSPAQHARTDLDVQRCITCHDPHFGEGKRLKAGWPLETSKRQNVKTSKSD